MRQAQKRRFARVILLLIIFLAVHTSSWAKNEPPYVSLLQGSDIKENGEVTVQDTVFFNPLLKPSVLRTNAVNNIISLRLNEYQTLSLPDSFLVEVKVRLIYTNKDNAVDSVPEKTFSITYNRFKSYKSKDVYFLQGAYRMQVKVLSVTIAYAPESQVLPLLELENKLSIDRDYVMNSVSGSQMNCSYSAIRKVETDVSSVPAYGELKISWTPTLTAHAYNVEWTYIDKSALDNGRYNDGNGQLSAALLFKNNATRITTVSDNAMIPLLYDGEGSLFFRVRGVQDDLSGERITTAWSSEFISDGGLGRFDFTGHERKLNWQATTTFAEEAKRKSVVQYFDGSLRSRQTVTRDNTTKTTVVAETFYDKQGRPAIQVLPAPTLKTLIGYTPLLNVSNINDREYDKGIYDTLTNASDVCDKGAPAMSTTSGTSNYYSAANPLHDNGMHQFIPDANGYAFSETKYTQDNTGRINKQSGVGEKFQIGTGHETKYYYGTPEQSDLDALFGTEAGDASHYQKNMVRDANGQYSVSYVDMHGRTIATALAGDSVRGLRRLGSYRDSIQTESLLTQSNNIISGTSIQSSKALLVPMAGEHVFSYNLGAESLSLKDCQQNDICYDCLYDLTITITDDCGNQLLGGNPVVFKRSNFRLFAVDTTCNVATPVTVVDSLWLEPGSYNITKTLSISQTGMQYYRDSLFLPHNTCKTFEDILREEQDSVRNGITCNASDDVHYDYESYRRDLLADLVPLVGQYGDTTAKASCYSIFNDINNNYQRSDLDYRDNEGNPAFVMNHLGIMVRPQALDRDEFIQNFQQSWTAALLPLHPEYRTLLTYESFDASLKWDQDFANTTTYAEARAKGFLNPTGNTTTIPASGFGVNNVDPLFTQYVISGAAKADLENNLFNRISLSSASVSLWGLSTAQAKCPNTNPVDQSCVIQWNSDSFDESLLCVGELDMAWKAFQSGYQTLKHDWLVNYSINASGGPSLNSPCIRNFVRADQALLDSGYHQTLADVAVGQAKVESFYDDNCRAYATRWWQQLQTPCNYTSPADSAVIISYLVQVCRSGTDVDHPFGSSTVKPGSTNRFKSFEEVIKFYNDSTGRTTDVNCNGYLLDHPFPYQHSAPVVTQQINSKPDDCACGKITTYYNQYTSVAGQYSNFSDFLFKKYGTSISQASLDSLRGLCSGAINCKFISNSIALPPLFQCAVNNTCVPCDSVHKYYNLFLQKFPGAVPTLTEEDTVQQKINHLFATYLNQQFGFSYAAQDYLQFLEQCGPSNLRCDSLSSLVDEFKNYYYSKPAGSVYKNYRLTKGAFDMINGANALLKARYSSQGEQLPSGWAFAPYNNEWSAKLKSVIPTRGSDSEYHAIVPLSRDAAWPTFSLSKLDNNNVAASDFVTNTASQFELSNKYYAISMQDVKTCFRNIFSTFQDKVLNSFYYYGLSTPTSKYLPVTDTTKNVDIHYYFFAFFNAGKSVTDGASYLSFYKDSVWNSSKDTLINRSYPYLYLSPGIPNSQIKGVKNLRYDTQVLPVTNMEQYLYSPIGLKVTVELLDGTEKDAYIHSFDHPCFKWQEAIDSNLYNPDCSIAFTTYFNGKQGTHYTYGQIDSLFAAVCGKPLDVCDGGCGGANMANYSCIKTYKPGVNHTQALFYDVQATADGGFLSVGAAVAPNGKKDAYVVKKDAKGNVLWSRLYGGAGEDVLQRVSRTSDGGFIANGWTASFKSVPEMWLLKLSADGALQWSRRYSGNTYNGEYGVGVIQTKDSGYAVTAHYNLAPYDSDWLLAKLNANGQVLWSKRMGSTSSDNAGSVIEDGDSLVVTAVHYSTAVIVGSVPFSYFNGIVLKVSEANGTVGWAKSYDLDFNKSDWFGNLRNTDSGYSINSNITDGWNVNNLHASMVYIDKSGNMQRVFRNSNITNTESNNAVGSVHPANDGGFYSLFGNQTNADIYIQKADRNGIVQWNNRITMPGNQFAYKLVEIPCGGLAISGQSDSLALFIRTDSIGKTACLNDTFSLPVVQPQYSTYPVSLPINSYVTLSTADVSTTDLGDVTSVSTICETTIPSDTNNGPLLCGKVDPFPPTDFVQEDPCADSTNIAIIRATERYRLYKDSLANAFEEAYQQKCLNAVNLETFTVKHPVSEYHYTLYFYDLAGNLVKTISPEGVHPNRNPEWLAQVTVKRAAGELLVPQHTLTTTYRYNSLNQVVSQKSPDGGFSEFWYDRLGRLVVSRNAKQKANGRWSYTLYDGLGRIIEVGQKGQAVDMTNDLSRNPVSLSNWLKTTYFNVDGVRCMAENVTTTIYDVADDFTGGVSKPIPVTQKAYTLRNRVSYTRTYDYLHVIPISVVLGRYAPLYGFFDYSTLYSYDIHGNVDTLLQHYNIGLMYDHHDGLNRFKVIAYKYDLISGKVNEVHYQPGLADQLYHRYAYDAENRLTDVYTTDNKLLIGDVSLEEHEAHYDYYKHGPLARTTLGHLQVQGLDYAYTLQGWLKGVNSTGLSPDLDMGEDGKPGGINRLVGRDAFGFNLNYFSGDYLAISGKNPFPGHSGLYPQGHADEYRPLYNGNIASMAVNIEKFNQPQLYNYQYDQLNRIVGTDVYRGFNTANNAWSSFAPVDDYKERVSYDGNGNILTYFRNGTVASGKPLGMDNLTYGYNKDADGNIVNNRLRHVKDDVAAANYGEDIDNQEDDNYSYDAIGNLTADKAEKILNIQWNVYGKISKITKDAVNDGDVQSITYTYDAAGNRLSKAVVKKGSSLTDYTWYVRDASGNVMAVYRYKGASLTDGTLYLAEHHLYGSSRLGIWNRNINLDAAPVDGGSANLLGATSGATFERGNKIFELSNHLGNVLVTVSDKKIGVDENNDGVIDYYKADVTTAQDYYPFGMLMPGRMGYAVAGGWAQGGTGGLPASLQVDLRSGNQPSEYKASQEIDFVPGFGSGEGDEFQAYITSDNGSGGSGSGSNPIAGGYRYGFNGQEKSDEIDPNGNSMTAEFWQYDARIGRRWNSDPLEKAYESPYASFGNNPLWLTDHNGADTTIEQAGGGGVANLATTSGNISGWSTYDKSTYYTISGTQTPIPVSPGQLRSFNFANLGTFSARWNTDSYGNAVFAGYKNDVGDDLNTAISKYNANLQVKGFFNDLDNFFSDPVNQALIIAAPLQMQMNMFESESPSAGNSSVVTTELQVTTEAEIKTEIETGVENSILNKKGVPYPKVVVEGYGEVPFPEGPYTPNNSKSLRPSFTAEYKDAFKQWWIGQGRKWPEAPEGSKVNIHHIKPLMKGGTNDFENLIPLIQPDEHQPFTNWWRSF